MEDTIKVIVASEKHLKYVDIILDTIEKAAKSLMKFGEEGVPVLQKDLQNM